jgi:hypothetical protein
MANCSVGPVGAASSRPVVKENNTSAVSRRAMVLTGRKIIGDIFRGWHITASVIPVTFFQGRIKPFFAHSLTVPRALIPAWRICAARTE